MKWPVAGRSRRHQKYQSSTVVTASAASWGSHVEDPGCGGQFGEHDHGAEDERQRQDPREGIGSTGPDSRSWKVHVPRERVLSKI
ncbi:hypothetical protein [Micromonospora sp. NPDC051296]|uniref:hypothetical protein n=1 Tax=Micromonospora sp. NPDC051296 TaxID=3155046 RepID=UPI00341F102F